MRILSGFNEMANTGGGGVCCPLDCEAILSLRSATFKLDQSAEGGGVWGGAP